jgi:hypothetical protein
MLREIQRVAGERVDAVMGGDSDTPMVRMQRIGPKGVVCDDYIRLVGADHSDDPLPKLHRRHDMAVTLAKKVDLGHAESSSGL